jgi:serine phosphatase RsbU (regulator of sigma subunit)
MILPKKLLDALFASGVQDFYHGMREYLDAASFAPFTLWQIDMSICTPVTGTYKNAEGRYDIHDLGFSGGGSSKEHKTLEFFDEKIEVFGTVFFSHMGSVYCAVSFHEAPDQKVFSELMAFSDYVGQRLAELIAREKNINVYVDYQKKIEFVKQSSRILRAVELDEVVAMALTFFMDVFSAEAGCVLHNSEFIGFGLEEGDVRNNIRIGSQGAYAYVMGVDYTEFIEDRIDCSKFNIENVFLIYEETKKIRILLFNIHFDIIPDKEFSELVSSIVSTAVENAMYHQKMTKLKIQESEMAATGEILNKFVSKSVSADCGISLRGINHPARAAGGDYMTVKETENGLFFCIADVCGKGYSAAVFTVVLSVFTENADLFDRDVALDKLAGTLNRFLLGKNFGDRFITAFFGYIDKRDLSLRYLSCGHEPVMHLSGDSDSKILSDFLPIGLMEEEYSVKTVPLAAGDSLFLYTDGLIEYMNEDNLTDKVKQLANSGADNILEVLYEDMVLDRETQRDDFTCMIIRI